MNGIKRWKDVSIASDRCSSATFIGCSMNKCCVCGYLLCSDGNNGNIFRTIQRRNVRVPDHIRFRPRGGIARCVLSSANRLSVARIFSAPVRHIRSRSAYTCNLPASTVICNIYKNRSATGIVVSATISYKFFFTDDFKRFQHTFLYIGIRLYFITYIDKGNMKLRPFLFTQIRTFLFI